MNAYEKIIATSGHPSIQAFISQNQPSYSDGLRRDSESTTASGVCEFHEVFPQAQTILANSCQIRFENSSRAEEQKYETSNQLFSQAQIRTGNASKPGDEEVEQEASENSSNKLASTPTRRQTYDKVDTYKRKLLLRLVDEEGESIKKASQRVGINYSTAKTILQLYRRSGRIQRLPHHKSSKARAQNLKIKIFKPANSPAQPLEYRAKIVKKEKSALMVPSTKKGCDSEAASFCTNLLMEIANGRGTEDLISPLLAVDFFKEQKGKGSQSQFQK